MNKKVIIQSQLNTYFQGTKNAGRSRNEQNEEWIKCRINIFKNYCLKSMKAQTNQWFDFILTCREETMPFINKEMGELPENIIIVGKKQSRNKIIELSKGYEILYLARVDSDDMWEKHFVDLLHNHNHKPETKVLINQNCYNYDIESGRMASFFYKSPQSYVLIYKPEEYAKGKNHYLRRGHGGAILLEHEIIAGFNYMDTIHGKNILSIFHPATWENWTEIKDKDDIKNILKDFGLTEGEQNHEEKE